jgi:tRNA 2-thiouridine synthesizing protein A
MTKKILNVKGLKCPIPVLKAEKVLKKLKTGDILEVLTTDPQAIKDFRAFCEVTNCLFQSLNKKKGIIKISICKSL